MVPYVILEASSCVLALKLNLFHFSFRLCEESSRWVNRNFDLFSLKLFGEIWKANTDHRGDIHMVVCPTTNSLALSGRYKEMEGNLQALDCYRHVGNQLAIIGDFLNERQRQRHLHYEEMIRLSSYASLGLTTGLAVFFTFQFLHRTYTKHQ